MSSISFKSNPGALILWMNSGVWASIRDVISFENPMAEMRGSIIEGDDVIASGLLKRSARLLSIPAMYETTMSNSWILTIHLACLSDVGVRWSQETKGL
jgi:hypothetical protein